MIKTILQIAFISFISIMVYRYFDLIQEKKEFHDKCVIAIVKKTKGEEPCVICKKKYHYNRNVYFTLTPANF